MRRRKSEAYKRQKRRQRKALFKTMSIFAIPIATLSLIITFLGNSIKDVISRNTLPDLDKYVSESSEESFNYNKIESDSAASEEEVEEELPEESYEEEIIVPEEPQEQINTDLLDMGYDFKDIDFNSLLDVNPDIIGWITIDGTIIDYPVLQGEDNEQYLHKDYLGNVSDLGSIYLDAHNESFLDPEYELDSINFIYGHHISKGRMFAQICNYKNQEFYEENPFFVIYTADGYAFKADVFAGVLNSGLDNTIYNNYTFVDEEDFNNYISYLRENSLIKTNIEPVYGDKFVVLVTCSYENGRNGNLRFMVFARLSKQYTNNLQCEEAKTLTLNK